MKSEVTTDGVRAVELFYRDIKRTSDNKSVFLMSQMRLNGPKMGVLEPDVYRKVAELSDQCCELFELGMHQFLQAIVKFQERDIFFKWVSLYMPVRFLKRDDSLKIISELCGKYKVKSEMICFEMDSSILDDDDERTVENMDKIRSSGYSFMLNNLAVTSSAMLRLADYSFDYVVLAEDIAHTVCKNERSQSCVRSFVSFAGELEAECIASDVISKDQAEKLSDCECTLYVGEYAGSFRAERYVRHKSSE